MDLMSIDSKKGVTILKLESQVSSQAEEINTLRNQSFNTDNTQIAKIVIMTTNLVSVLIQI